MFRLIRPSAICLLKNIHPIQIRQISSCLNYTPSLLVQPSYLPRTPNPGHNARCYGHGRETDVGFDSESYRELELEIDVSKHQKIFSYSDSGRYTRIFWAGVVGFFMWGYNAQTIFFYTTDEPSLEARKGWRDTWLYQNKKRFGATCILIFFGTK